MSYQHQKPPKKMYDGKTLVPLSVAAEIVEIRDQIEKNHQHAGGQLELVHHAYSEIQAAHGHVPRKLDPTCSGCIKEMNDLLKNWFRLLDQGTIPQRAAAGAFKSKPLKPLKPLDAAKPEAPSKPSTDLSEMTYAELLELFKAKATKKEQDEINGGKAPKKAQIIKFLTNGKG